MASIGDLSSLEQVKSKPYKPEPRIVMPKTLQVHESLEGRRPGNVTLVIMGRSAAGKSSLLRNIFTELPENPKLSAEPDTIELKQEIFTRNNTTLKIVDSIGLSQDKTVRKQQLKELARFTNKKADLVVLCIPVMPGTRFESDTPQIMNSLQLAFGKNIWRHCLVVFTFSNLAWEHVKAMDDAVKQYITHINKYTTLFQQELVKQIPSPDVTVGSIFESPDCTPPSGESSVSSTSSSGEPSTEPVWENRPTIVTIPAGRKPTDTVLLGIREQWTEMVFAEMLESAVAEAKMDLLKFRYNTEFIKRAIISSYNKVIPKGIRVFIKELYNDSQKYKK